MPTKKRVTKIKTTNKRKTKCTHCERRKAEDMEQDEINLAVLIALVPIMVVVIFKHLGLF